MQIFVLGMHRSGTSLLARVLNLLGASVGDPAGLMEANEVNPKGFWEIEALAELDEGVLRQQACAWNRVARFKPTELGDVALEPLRLRARDFVMRMDANRPWVVKDPRLCLLMPFWTPLLECPVCVLIHRDPIEIAVSLQKAQGVPLLTGVALWERYVLSALEGSADLPRTLVAYHDLISDPARTLKELHRQLTALGVRKLECPSEKELSSAIDSSLYRNRLGTEAVIQYLNESQRQLLQALENGDALEWGHCPHISAGAEAALEEYEALLDSQESTIELQRILGDVKSQAEDLQQRNDVLEHRVSELASASTELESMRQRKDVLERHSAELESTCVAHRNECDELRGDLRLQQQNAGALQVEVARLSASYAELLNKLETDRSEWAQLKDSLRAELGKSQELSERRGAYIEHLEQTLGSYHDALLRRNEHVARLKSSVEAVYRCAERMNRSVWCRVGSVPVRLLGRALPRSMRPRTLLEHAREIVLSTRRWYRGEYNDYFISGDENIERDDANPDEGDRYNRPLFVEDYQQLLTWLDRMVVDWRRMYRQKWWRLGTRIYFMLRKLHLRRRYTIWEATEGESIAEAASRWREEFPQLLSTISSEPESSVFAASEIRRLTSAADRLDALQASMQNTVWWRLGETFRLFYTSVRPAKRIEQRPAERLELIAAEYHSWLEGIGDLTVRFDPKANSPTAEYLQAVEASLGVDSTQGGQNFRFLPERVDIVVPIYNQYDCVRRCILSVFRNTSFPYRLILVDDCSTDPDLDGFYASIDALDFVVVHRNLENVGFVQSVNRGFALSEHDIVLLNSDVSVTPRWLQKLLKAAYSSPDNGIVTTLSNAATIFSVPEFGEVNQLPETCTNVSMARLVEDVAERRYISVPTAVGCCMYVKRQALNDVGFFDAETFGRGYGEENDFCMRAAAKGWRTVLDDSTFIFHESSASFGSEKQELSENNLKTLSERYPDYLSMVARCVDAGGLREIVGRVKTALERRNSHSIPPAEYLGAQESKRLLYVLHDGGGGTSYMASDLLDALPRFYESYYLTCDTRTLRLARYIGDGKIATLEEHTFVSPIEVTDFTHPEYLNNVSDILLRYDFDLVHIHHLISHSFDLPRVAGRLGVPCLFSLHDFYFLCPTVHMLNYDGEFCGGNCVASGERQCVLPTPNLAKAPLLPGKWALTWRNEVRSMFRHANAFLAPSASARRFYLSIYPELADKPFPVIEHGHDMDRDALAVWPEPGQPARIVTMGDIVLHKGAELLKELALSDRARNFEIHVLGPHSATLEDVDGIVCHGRYKREDLPRILRRLRPTFIALLSIWPETFAYTLSEAWSLGIPAIVSNLGALKERVDREGGGWVVNIDDAARLYDQVLQIVRDRSDYSAKLAEISRMSIITTEKMAGEYDTLYRSLIHGCTPDVEHAARSKPVVAVIPGSRKPPYNSTDCYRLVLPYQALAKQGEVDVVVCDLDRVADYYPDVIVVQRNSFSFEEASALVDFCRNDDVRLIYDIDDNLLDMESHPEEDQYRAYHPVIKLLLRAANLVTVTTENLREALSDFNSNIRVVPNCIDRGLWLSGGADFDVRPSQHRSDSVVFGYMGTVTHASDLEVIKQAVMRVRERHPQVRFELIGGRPCDDGEDWYSRVQIPVGCYDYVNFVRWFRQNCHWDFAVAPLEANSFNRYKSYIKALEYSVKELPGIFTNNSIYNGVIESGVNGILVANTTEAWDEAIERLVMDERLRLRLGQAAYERVINEHILEDNLYRWRECVDDVLEFSVIRHRTTVVP